MDDLNFDITNLKISVSYFDESETSLDEIQERIKNEIENANQSINNKQVQIEQIKQRYYCEKNKNASYGELVNINNLVSDEEIEQEFGDRFFVEDDFC